MLKGIIGRVFGTRHERERRRVQPIINEVVEIEARLAQMPDAELQAQTARFRARIAERTGPIEEQITALKAEKRNSGDAVDRDRIETELQGADGRGGAEGEFRLSNFEMETAGYYSLGRMLGHEVLSLNAIVANRATGEFAENAGAVVDAMIERTLLRLV